MLRHDRQGRRVRTVPEDRRGHRAEKCREQRGAKAPGNPMSRPGVGFFDWEIEDYGGSRNHSAVQRAHRRVSASARACGARSTARARSTTTGTGHSSSLPCLNGDDGSEGVKLAEGLLSDTQTPVVYAHVRDIGRGTPSAPSPISSGSPATSPASSPRWSSAWRSGRSAAPATLSPTSSASVSGPFSTPTGGWSGGLPRVHDN